MRSLVMVAAAVLGWTAGAAPARAWYGLPPGETAWRDAGHLGIRGITVGPIESSQQPGRGYGTEASAELLDELARMGTTWISITPFGRIWSLQSKVKAPGGLC